MSKAEATNPYLGYKISLISQSKIRYEGILYSVDHKSSTIALTDVRSFGTEDRKTDVVIAPRTEVFECIIFKAADIKDLRICQKGKAEELEDPAIVAIHKAAPSMPAQTGSHTLPPSCAALAPNSGTHHASSPNTPSSPFSLDESSDSGDPAGYDGGPVKLLFNQGKHESNESRRRRMEYEHWNPSSRLRPTAKPFLPAGLPPLPPVPPQHLFRHGFSGHDLPPLFPPRHFYDSLSPPTQGFPPLSPPMLRRPRESFYHGRLGRPPPSPGRWRRAGVEAAWRPGRAGRRTTRRTTTSRPPTPCSRRA